MKTLPYFQPIFSYLSLQQRWIDQGGRPIFSEVKTSISALLNQLKKETQTDFFLKAVYHRVRLPLIFYIDFIISQFKAPVAQEWSVNRLAGEENEFAGDEKFFHILDELMDDVTEEGLESLAVLYQCMGQGFLGWYQQTPEKVRALMEKVALRLPEHPKLTDLIAPAAYQATDERSLIKMPYSKRKLLVWTSATVIALSCILYYYIFNVSTQKLSDSVDYIIKMERFLYPNANMHAK